MNGGARRVSWAFDRAQLILERADDGFEESCISCAEDDEVRLKYSTYDGRPLIGWNGNRASPQG